MRIAAIIAGALFGAVLLASCEEEDAQAPTATATVTATVTATRATRDATATIEARETEAVAEATAAARSTTTPTPVVVIVQATPPATLKPADSQRPAAGVCAGPGDDAIVTIHINPHMPSTRCAYIKPGQRIRFVNNLDRPVRIALGPFDETIEPRHGLLFDAPAGSYLAPGVHVVYSSVPTGRPVLWLIEGSPP